MSNWVDFEAKTVDAARENASRHFGRNTRDLEFDVISEGAKGLFGLGGEPAVVRARPAGSAPDYTSAFQTHTDFIPSPAEEPEPVAESPAGEAAPVRHTSASAPALGEVPQKAEIPTPPATQVASWQQSGTNPQAQREAEEAPCTPEDMENAAKIAAGVVDAIISGLGMDATTKTTVEDGTVRVEIEGEELGPVIGRGGNTLIAIQELARAAVQRKLTSRCALVVDAAGYWSRRRAPRATNKTQ